MTRASLRRKADSSLTVCIKAKRRFIAEVLITGVLIYFFSDAHDPSIRLESELDVNSMEFGVL